MSSFTCKNIPLPIGMFLSLFNALPKSSSLRSYVLYYIKIFKHYHDPKVHTMEGFTILENGDLTLNKVLYMEAV